MEIERISEESMACVYEDGALGWWKTCNDADEFFTKGIKRDSSIEWSKINVIDLKLCKNQTTENTFILLDIFLNNKFTSKILHLTNWNDVNFFNESFYSVMEFLNNTEFKCELKLELVNKPKIEYEDFTIYKKDIVKTLSFLKMLDFDKFKSVDYFYYYAKTDGLSTYIPVKNIENINEWKIYDSNQVTEKNILGKNIEFKQFKDYVE
mgnify:CR=1 FL=1|tara:strand:- start:818 stop:1441 length:624 start_codon:yes stop_codon:yes gene_type:complete